MSASKPFIPSDFSGRPLSADGFVGPLVSSAGSVPYWGDSPEVWDTVLFNGEPLPGICRVGGKAFEVKKDSKSPPGSHGAAVTTLGREAAEPEFRIQLWTAEHLRTFQRVMEAFLPKSGKALPGAVAVVHPALTIYKIKSVLLLSASFPEEKEPQVFEVVLKTIEHSLKRGKVSTKNDTSITSRGPGAVPAEIAKRKALLDPSATNGNEPRNGTGTP